jgi:hypothetical protein
LLLFSERGYNFGGVLPQFENGYEDPQARRYQEDHAPVAQLVSVASWHDVLEVARFVVPYGSTGFIERIEQYGHVVDEQGEERVFSASPVWGVPYQQLSLGTNQLRWYLRLVPMRRGGTVLQRRWYQANTTFIPGIPYRETPQIDGWWYPAGSPACRVRWIVPGDYALCLLVHVYRPAEGGKPVYLTGSLAGWTQGNGSTFGSGGARNSWESLSA